MLRFGWIAVVSVVSACAPQVVGEQVGQSLYNASVTTGNALANFGDRTGAALQNAGTNLRRSSNPPPADYDTPPPYDQGMPSGGAAPQVPVQAQPID